MPRKDVIEKYLQEHPLENINIPTWMFSSKSHHLLYYGVIYSIDNMGEIPYSRISEAEMVIEIIGNYYLTKCEEGSYKPDYSKQIIAPKYGEEII